MPKPSKAENEARIVKLFPVGVRLRQWIDEQSLSDDEVTDLLLSVYPQVRDKVLKEHLSKAGKNGGAATTDAKRRASAENGKKGGRPKKQST
jgi:hypothetical protein